MMLFDRQPVVAGSGGAARGGRRLRRGSRVGGRAHQILLGRKQEFCKGIGWAVIRPGSEERLEDTSGLLGRQIAKHLSMVAAPFDIQPVEPVPIELLLPGRRLRDIEIEEFSRAGLFGAGTTIEWWNEDAAQLP